MCLYRYLPTPLPLQISALTYNFLYVTVSSSLLKIFKGLEDLKQAFYGTFYNFSSYIQRNDEYFNFFTEKDA